MRSGKRLFAALLIIFAVLAIANIEVHITQSIDGVTRQIKMPLYVKWIEFLSRHYEYRRIAAEITSGCDNDTDKALAILKWTHENIRRVPAGMPVVDDHVYNIIVRGYGTDGQSQDVFTTLCAYSDIPAFWDRLYDASHKVRFLMSFVKIDGRWLVFDSYNNRYFRTSEGQIASVNDILSDASSEEGVGLGSALYRGMTFKEFYSELKTVSKDGSTKRPYKQMPLSRVLFEIKKAIGIEIEKEDLAVK